MRKLREWMLRFGGLFDRQRKDRELDAEIEGHLQMHIEDNLRLGMSPEEARRQAMIQLGGVESTKEAYRDQRGLPWLETLWQDVRYGARQLRRNPGFTAVAVLTLALGIGANTALFGVVKSVLLDPLPYHDADRLKRVHMHFLDGRPGAPNLNAEMVDMMVSRQHSFESLAAFDSARDAVCGSDDDPHPATIAWVEPHLFRTLGVQAILGRTFADDDRAIGHVPASGAEVGPDTAQAVVLTFGAWQRLFAGDPGVVGREVRVNRIPRVVIGVLAPDFVGPKNGMEGVDFYFAFDLRAAIEKKSGVNWLGLVGRVKPGIDDNTARREIAAIWASRENRQAFSELGMSATTLRESMVGTRRTVLLVLLASAALALLIACANLAGAFLSRGLSRCHEFGVRVALGASRRRIVRQLLTESMVLAFAGGAAGLLLAFLLLAAMRGVATPLLPAYADLSLNINALLVTATMAVCTGLVFGVLPAMTIARDGAQSPLRDDARGASESRRSRRLRGVFVTVQLALCASLLTGGTLVTRGLWKIAITPVGFDPVGVLAARFRLSTPDYPTVEGRARLHEQLLERLRSLPGVDAVAIANKTPAVDSPRTEGFSIEGTLPNAVEPSVQYASVSDEYFRALRIPVLGGRTFDASDHAGSPPTVVISDAMARRYWPRGNALGTRIRLSGELVEIIGIVGDVRNDVARTEVNSMVYRSHRQESTHRFCVLLRTRRDPLALTMQLQKEVAAIDPGLLVQQPKTLESAVGGRLASRRVAVWLLSAFGALSLLLASVGVYGMFASIASAREREFGIRLALGSRPSSILALVLLQGSGWLAAGLVGGALGTALVLRLLRNLIEGMPPIYPIDIAFASAMLIVCATFALLIPGTRAMRVNPIVALRL